MAALTDSPYCLSSASTASVVSDERCVRAFFPHHPQAPVRACQRAGEEPGTRGSHHNGGAWCGLLHESILTPMAGRSPAVHICGASGQCSTSPPGQEGSVTQHALGRARPSVASFLPTGRRPPTRYAAPLFVRGGISGSSLSAAKPGIRPPPRPVAPRRPRRDAEWVQQCGSTRAAATSYCGVPPG